MWNILNQYETIKFVIGGCSAVLVDYLTYVFLLEFFPLVSMAKLVSFVAGSSIGFVINKFWTFNSKGLVQFEILKYFFLYLITAYLNVFANNLALSWLFPTWLAFFVATGTSTIINYLGQKFFVFREKRCKEN